MRVGLISCSKRKLAHAAPAAELYQGELFKLSRAWIAKPGRVGAWGILSAKHGLVMPDQILEPYEMSLRSVGSEARAEWARRTHLQLVERWGPGAIYMVLAGCDYRDALLWMPMTEDVIAHWTAVRKRRGMRRPGVGIGVMKRLLREGASFC